MQFLQDVRVGFRSLIKNPGLTLIALALGIGANATVFTFTNAVLFKGFPFDKSDRILDDAGSADREAQRSARAATSSVNLHTDRALE
jgi:hypothetical protein